MSKWICKRCGTICQDFMDTLDLMSTSPIVKQRVDKLLNERIEIESRGEMPPLKCQCGEKRIW